MAPTDPAARAADRLAAQRRAVFAACRAQGLDDDTRRALQKRLTGKDSLAGMSPREIARVLDHLNARGAPAAYGEVAGAAIAACPQLQKIARLLAARRIAMLLEDGYGGNGLRLIELLEAAQTEEKSHD